MDSFHTETKIFFSFRGSHVHIAPMFVRTTPMDTGVTLFTLFTFTTIVTPRYDTRLASMNMGSQHGHHRFAASRLRGVCVIRVPIVT